MEARALSNHLMRRMPAKAFRGNVGLDLMQLQKHNASRWTRYLDENKRRIFMSNNDKFFVVNWDNKKKTNGFKVAYLAKHTTANVNYVPIRSNTPLPKEGLKSINNKGHRIYTTKRDKYGRILATVYINKGCSILNINQIMVEEKYGKPYYGGHK